MKSRSAGCVPFFVLSMLLACFSPSVAEDRLAYLDHPCDPYYVGLDFPKLTTPQWVGEEGVEAVVILSIDDMRDAKKYEDFLRPLLNRLKQIDGRAPLTIFTNSIDPQDPQLQRWIDEGLSLEVHTADHPCPLLQGGDFDKARDTYERCVDNLFAIPRSRPVAFRMPCCDSLNTPSPRFWTEIFEKRTAQGNYLTIDSSVFNVITPADPSLPREIVFNEDGEERFRRYLPFPSFVNTIENYPYPYLIGKYCWEFPCAVPSDWEAQNVQQPNNPRTVADWKRVLDATVIKQGVMPIVFHPHGWIRADQLADFVDYAAQTYGTKVKFLAFDEALQRLNQHLLEGALIRGDRPTNRSHRLVDIDGDGYLDVIRPALRDELLTRVWLPKTRQWRSWNQAIPTQCMRFGQIDGKVMFAAYGMREQPIRFFSLDAAADQWDELSTKIALDRFPEPWRERITRPSSIDDFQFRDTDGDGTSEWLLTHDGETILARWDAQAGWVPNRYRLPEGTRLLTTEGQDAGLRFVDVNGDGHEDIVFADGRRYALHLFENAETGWSHEVRSGGYGDTSAIPPIVRTDGTNNGVWFHSDHLWAQNEDTNRLPDLVDRLAFRQMSSTGLGSSNATSPNATSPNATSPNATSPNENSRNENSTNENSRNENSTNENSTGEVFPPAKSPEESLASFQPRPGMTVELVAHEPDVVDPVAFDWGPDGRLWVAEMRDYPNGLTWNKQGDPLGEPGGRVKLLVDTDRDGKHDQVHVFLDKVPFVSGVKAWRDGVLVTAAPDVFYAEDTDGDGRADKREVLYRGFAEGNQQHRVNGLRWGIDQWLYLANGHSGGNVMSIKTGDKVRISGRDVRIKPDQGLIETQSGTTQCGRCSDDDGNWFGGDNSNPVWHYALDEHYLGRNPHYAPPSVRHSISVMPGAAPVFPASQTLTRFNDYDRANRYTSACSPEVFRDDYLIDKDPRRFIYVCEPVHNLVAREVLRDNGTTFTSQRDPAEQDREFLASSDNWVRPSMVRTGPDGALWVADMYRLVIEHPEWIPKQWQDRLDLRAGADKGRIYRIRFDGIPPDHPGITPWYLLDKLATDKLVAALDSSNGTLREMVQQLIYWRNDRSAIAPLKQLLKNATWPQSRLNALYLLDSFQAADDGLLARWVKYGGGSLSRHAIRLSEPRFQQSPPLKDVLFEQLTLRAVSGEDRRAQQQLAYSLGEMHDPRVGAALARLAMDYRDDPYLTAAVMSSVNAENVAPLLADLIKSAAPAELVSAALGFAVALDQPRAVSAALMAVAKRPDAPLEQLSTMRGFVAAIQRRNVAIDEFLAADGQQAARTLFAVAREVAEDPSADEASRLAAFALLGNETPLLQRDRETLVSTLTPLSSPDIQAGAIAALTRLDADDTSQMVLAAWRSYTPALRYQVLDMLLSREKWSHDLLTAVEAGLVLPSQIDARHRQQLARNKSSQIGEIAQRLFASSTASSRQVVVRQYSSVAELAADPERGREIFAKRCATCHRFDGQGQAVGPDLAALTDKSHEALVVAILDPNRAVEDKYLDYLVATNNGQQYTGLLAAETAASVTLTLADGKQQDVLRGDIEEIAATGKSLMPEGLEQDIPPQDLADLIAHVRSVTVPPKRFPGNEPRVAPMRDDGSIRLFAMHARIYGSTLVFEPRYRNLGFWESADDRAVWTLNVPQAGTYSVNLDYACDDGSAGNQFVITAAGETLRGVVAGTGSWDNYSWQGVGRIDLPAGEVEVTLKGEGLLTGYLGDFRTIILVPR